VDVLLPPSLLAFSGVGKRFPDGTVALAGVDLSVAPGEFVSILGPSGCGKSTLLRVAAGLSQASDGTAKVGTDKIGYVFQDPTDTKVFTSRATPTALPLSHPWVRLVGVEWPGRCVTRPRPSAEPRARGADVELSNRAKADAGRRYRAYPTPEQAGRLAGWGHSCRAVWNLALAQRDHLYRHRGVTLRANAQCVQLTRARRDLPWLADLPAQSAQQVLRQLDRAYDI
jgi:hypothetical protein